MLYIHQTTCISPQRTFVPPGAAQTDIHEQHDVRKQADVHEQADLNQQATEQADPNQSGIDLLQVRESADNKLYVIEPDYEGLPKNAARRMSKSVRIGVGAALPLIRQAAVLPLTGQSANSPMVGRSANSPMVRQSAAESGSIDGIIIGTASAGMEESIQFMKQIIDHEEGILSPGAFVQSTANTIASQISLLSGSKSYNSTHVQGGLAFENALLDAAMLLAENPLNSYLCGGVDEIGTLNYNIDYLDGWYKHAPLSSTQLYTTDSTGSLAGEGAAMFLVNNRKSGAMVKLQALTTLHSEAREDVEARLRLFLDQQVPRGEKIDLLLTGENGDNRLLKYYSSCEAICESFCVTILESSSDAEADSSISPASDLTIARYKHMCGEYPTASAFALWLACQVLVNQFLPPYMIKKQAVKADPIYKNVLIYNTYKGSQHSLMLVSKIC